jgi:hypothetical protein
MHAVPAGGYAGGLDARTEALIEQAAAAILGDPAPAEEILWLAEQLADNARLLGLAGRAGSVAAVAYERGRLDERTNGPRGVRLPA